VEYCKERMFFINRNSLGKFYAIVRNDFLKDKKALSNQVIRFLETSSDHIWEQAFKKLDKEDLDTGDKSARNLLKFGSLGDLKVFEEKNAISEEMIVNMYFNRGQMDMHEINEKSRFLREKGYFDIVKSIDDPILNEAAKRCRMGPIIEALHEEADRDLLYHFVKKYINNIESSDRFCFLIYELAEKHSDILYKKDENGLDCIQLSVKNYLDQKEEFDKGDVEIFDKVAVLEVIRIGYDLFKEEYGIYSVLTEERKEFIKNEHPSVHAEYERKSLNNLMSENGDKFTLSKKRL
jgi:hypothetical protein